MCARVRVKRNLDARSDRLLYGTWHFLFFSFSPFFFFFRNATGLISYQTVRYIERLYFVPRKFLRSPDLSPNLNRREHRKIYYSRNFVEISCSSVKVSGIFVKNFNREERILLRLLT